MARPIAPDYGQQFLFPPALEDWVPADHPARFLREFVEQLDLPALGFAMPLAVEGRPPYAPSLLLKIWLYGYFQRIRSTRKLEVACAEHLSLLWLTGLIAPDHNSLWRFWRDNKKALRHLFKQTVQLALHTGAVGLALQALDGTKIQAACSGPHGWSKDHMEKLLVQLDDACQEIELKIAEENTDVERPGYRLPAGMAERKALRQQIKEGLTQLQADGRHHYHPAEPEARRMKVGDTNRYAYNAQAIADETEGVIVACEATRQETDAGQLTPMIQQARENLGVAAPDTLTVADTGYGSGGDLQAAAQKQMNVLAPPPKANPRTTIPTPRNTFITIRPPTPSPAHKPGPWTTKVTPPKAGNAWNVFVVTTATVRYARTAPATPRAGRSKCGRTELKSKPCARGCNNRSRKNNGGGEATSSNPDLPNSNNTTASGAGPYGDWKAYGPSGRSCAPR